MLKYWEPPTDPWCDPPIWVACKECEEILEINEAVYPGLDDHKSSPCCSKKCARIIDEKLEEHLPEELRTWWDD